MMKIDISTDKDANWELTKKLAVEAAREAGGDVTLLSYYDQVSGTMVPRTTCAESGDDGHRIYAENRGADLRIVINEGDCDFFFKTTPDDTVEPESDHANVVGAIGARPGDDFGTFIGG